MPELPEVETVRRQLAPPLEGRRLERLEVLDARWCAPAHPDEVADAVAGRAIERLGRRGKYLIADLEADAEYQRRLAAGEVAPPPAAAEIELLPYAKRSVAIFLAGVLAICLFGFVEGIRPTVAAEGGGVEPMSVTPLIQMFMLTAAALILLFCHVKAGDVPGTAIFKSGMVAMIALFGIA